MTSSSDSEGLDLFEPNLDNKQSKRNIYFPLEKNEATRETTEQYLGTSFDFT